MRVYVGYDAREHDAFEVCEHSILKHSPTSEVIKLDANDLSASGAYNRRFKVEDGQRYDLIDGKPFSTDFAFTRFLVPYLAQEGWALFCDCDFLFRADVDELMQYADPHKAVVVVQHQSEHTEGIKMDGQKQTVYPRKNWSSLMLFNCDHPATQRLLREDVNNRSGAYLHRFEWCWDEDIGSLPQGWNWLSGVSDPLPDDELKAVHYTLGGPWFDNCKSVPKAEWWLDGYNELRRAKDSDSKLAGAV